MLYELMIKYFLYIHRRRKNSIAVFWRLLLRIFNIYGIDIDLKKCTKCGSSDNDFAAFYPQKNGFICNKCYLPAYAETTLKITKKSAEVLSNISFIGNLLDDIEISADTVKLINNIFLVHLAEHFHQNFHLKSLKLYSSSIPQNPAN